MRVWIRQRFGVSSALSLLGALISGVGAVWVFAQEDQFVGISAIVVFIGVLISIVGAFASSGERTRFERELRESSEENARLIERVAWEDYRSR